MLRIFAAIYFYSRFYIYEEQGVFFLIITDTQEKRLQTF